MASSEIPPVVTPPAATPIEPNPVEQRIAGLESRFDQLITALTSDEGEPTAAAPATAAFDPEDRLVLQQGLIELQQSATPKDRAIARTVTEMAVALRETRQEVAVMKADRARDAEVLRAVSPDLAEAQSLVAKGDVKDLKLAQELVALRKQVAGGAPVAGGASTAGGDPALPPPAPAAAPAPAPARTWAAGGGPPTPPPAAGAPAAGTMKNSDYARAMAEEVNGRPTERALALQESVRKRRVTLVPG